MKRLFFLLLIVLAVGFLGHLLPESPGGHVVDTVGPTLLPSEPSTEPPTEPEPVYYDLTMILGGAYSSDLERVQVGETYEIFFYSNITPAHETVYLLDEVSVTGCSYNWHYQNEDGAYIEIFDFTGPVTIKLSVRIDSDGPV